MASFRGIELPDQDDQRATGDAPVERVMGAAGLTLRATYLDKRDGVADGANGRAWPHHVWALDVCMAGQPVLTVPEFRMGMAHVDADGDPVPPSWDDLWTALTRTPPEPFEEWAPEYGYDSDSRKAYATWKACRAEYRRVRGFLRRMRAALGRDYPAFEAFVLDLC